MGKTLWTVTKPQQWSEVCDIPCYVPTAGWELLGLELMWLRWGWGAQPLQSSAHRPGRLLCRLFSLPHPCVEPLLSTSLQCYLPGSDPRTPGRVPLS